MELKVNSSVPIRFEKIKNNEDERVINVKILVAHEGLNLNQSYFSKEVLEHMGQNLSGVPIVGYVAEDGEGNDDFKGHEMKIIVTENGIDHVYLGAAFGCVLNDNNARFEVITCDDGIDRNYLCCDAILWRKFSKYTDIFERDGYKSQSMELLPSSIQGNFAEDKAFHFTDAIVEALCALGEGVNPAMKNSIIEKYSLSTIKEQIREILNELKESNIVSSIENSTQEGAFSIDENIHQSIENFPKEDEVVPDVKKTKKQIAEQFSLTTNQLYDELYNETCELKYTTQNWYGEDVEVSRYCMIDFDESFVYAKDRQNNFQDVKMSYTKNGDNVTINFDSATRIKWSPVDWEGTEDDVEMENYTVKILYEVKRDFDKAIEDNNEISLKLEKQSTSLLDLNEKFTTLESTVAEKNTQLTEKQQELDTLKEFKLQIEKNERQEKVDNLFEKYKKHLTKEDVDSFKEKEPTFAQFEELEREVKLFVADKVAEQVSNSASNNQTQFTSMGLPLNKQNGSTEAKSLWDNLECESK